MHMNQKGFVSVVVIGISVAILLGIAGYFILVKKPAIFNNSEVSRISTNMSHKVSSAELDTVNNLFQKNNLDLNGLQIVDVNVSENYDKTTTFHIKANQFYRGIPIFNDWVAYHIKKTGEIESITGERISNLNISIDPKISENEAVKIARAKMSGGYKFAVELGIYRKYGEKIFELAWEIHTDNKGFPSQVAYVDANTGELLYYFDGMVF